MAEFDEILKLGSSRHSDPICPGVFSIKFYQGKPIASILANSGAKKSGENRFRRDVVWSQRGVDKQNKYTHRHQHP
ncbi:hypothetical protein PRIPAC_84357 [Pristionchus pacificus]|uniref:Uncharacterized protein n=1 Tax=Pristionchus pacificus TaxID=54126 RepID=A0A2A6BL17_PRIPA|nr:hypothetical protein PRIPAC_84357 [Pristionchus pacificus]|eukprot:PDM66513.1 hypothetical protein PRIPAC_47930 [Pristionchus pacificus]